MAPRNMSEVDLVNFNDTLHAILTYLEESVSEINLSDLYQFVLEQVKDADTQRTVCIVLVLYLGSLVLRALFNLLSYIFCCRCCRKQKN